MGSASSPEVELEGMGQALKADAGTTDHFEAAGVGNQGHIDLSQDGVYGIATKNLILREYI